MPMWGGPYLNSTCACTHDDAGATPLPFVHAYLYAAVIFCLLALSKSFYILLEGKHEYQPGSRNIVHMPQEKGTATTRISFRYICRLGEKLSLLNSSSTDQEESRILICLVCL